MISPLLELQELYGTKDKDVSQIFTLKDLNVEVVGEVERVLRYLRKNFVDFLG